MPVILDDPDLEALWLDPTVTDVGELEACLASPASDELEMFPVSDLVNSARHEGPELVEPVMDVEPAPGRRTKSP